MNEEQESLSMVLETLNEAHMHGLLKSIVVVGLAHDGEVQVGFSVNDPLKVIGLLEAGKHDLLQELLYEGEE